MDVIDSISTYAQIIGLVLPFLLVIAAALILYFRGARYVFLDRIWSLIHRKDFGDEILRKYHEGQIDLERFKFMYGIRSIESLPAAYAAKAWADEIGLTLRTMGKARYWVNWETRQVKKASKLGDVLAWLLYVGVGIATCFPLAGAISNDMLARFKESGSWVWMNDNRATELSFSFSKPWVLTKADCEVRPLNMPDTSLSAEEAEILCGSFGTEELQSAVEENVRAQRWIMGFLTVFMIGVLWTVFMGLMVRLRAADIRRRVDKVAALSP